MGAKLENVELKRHPESSGLTIHYHRGDAQIDSESPTLTPSTVHTLAGYVEAGNAGGFRVLLLQVWPATQGWPIGETDRLMTAWESYLP